MSDESRYYKIGQERGADDKSTPLGIFNLADKAEASAAQRGWEAGQSAREHADAVQAALDKASEDSDSSSSDYSSSDYTPSSSSSSSTPSGSSIPEPVLFILWTGGSWLLGMACLGLMKTVTLFSFVWWILCLVFVACLPGMITGAIAAIAAGIVICIILLIIAAVIALIQYFVQHPV